MPSPSAVRQSCAALAAALLLSPLAVAGDLTPPPGAPAPTMKTLAQVEARTPVNTLPGSATAVHVISASGSYYLTGDVVGATGKNGIEIQADGVDLDLNGFSVRGNVAGALTGIKSTASSQSVNVHDGRVTDWPEWGITLNRRASVRNVVCTTENALGSSCIQVGLPGGGGVAGHAVVVDCVVGGKDASSMPIFGVQVWGDGAEVRGVSATYCTNGFYMAGNDALVADCEASSCSTGIVLVGRGNQARGNAIGGAGLVSGISVGSSAIQCLVTANSISSSTSAGIGVAGAWNVIDGNSVSSATGTGLVANGPGTGNLLTRNMVRAPNAFVVAVGNTWTSSTTPATAPAWANISF